MIERTKLNGTAATVTFRLPATVYVRRASVCGEFNDWSPVTHPMMPDGDGGFAISIQLPVGRDYRFRYLVDGVRWENDWAADRYDPNDFGGNDSVVSLISLEGD